MPAREWSGQPAKDYCNHAPAAITAVNNGPNIFRLRTGSLGGGES